MSCGGERQPHAWSSVCGGGAWYTKRMPITFSTSSTSALVWGGCEPATAQGRVQLVVSCAPL